MFGFLIFLHIVICLLLVIIILMQSGRGGGLTEGFAAAESMFGAKTNSMMVKGTTIFASIFLITCLSLAFLSAHQNKSLLHGRVTKEQKATAKTVGTPVPEAAATAGQVENKVKQEAGELKQAVSSDQTKTEIKETAENAQKQNTSAPQVPEPKNPASSQ